MNKNELKDDIKNALEDLMDDYKVYEQKYENFQNISSPKDSLQKHFPKNVVDKLDIPKASNKLNNYSFGYALIKLLSPQIFGIVIGCAFARLFQSGFIGYVILCIIFAFLVGVHKSTYDDRITLRYAVIKNIVLMFIEIILILLIVAIYGIIYMIG